MDDVVKKSLDKKSNKIVIPKEREVYWISIGQNIGYEQNGKGDILSRPILVLKKFPKQLFFGIPLSTSIKKGDFFYNFEYLGKKQCGLLVQGRVFDGKRLGMKIGKINEKDFQKLKNKWKKLFNI